MSGDSRKRSSSEAGSPNVNDSKKRPSSAIMAITRSIAACKRCRTKKIKCDQRFPTCSKCAAANDPCVSVDPATGRDVPRSYVVFLEDRLEAMMNKLKECGVDPTHIQGNIPATDRDNPCDLKLYEEQMRDEHKIPHDNIMAGYIINHGTSIQKGVSKGAKGEVKSSPGEPVSELSESARRLESLGSMKRSQHKSGESALGAASNSYLGDSSGIPFAKLIFTAINFLPDAVEEAAKQEEEEPEKKDEDLVVDISYLPTKMEAQELVSQYFARCNSQLPILHREYFLKRYFEPIYGTWDKSVSMCSDTTLINENFTLPPDKIDEDLVGDPWYDPLLSEVDREPKEVPSKFHTPLFFLNIVMAIGDSAKILISDERRSVAFKNRASTFMDALFRSDDLMAALAGTLLIAQYSTMRPNVPGVWYTMGSALRLAVDLGLHAEKLNRNYDPFTRDMRRRLFWCTYSLDRQICAFFGRPFGIPDENVSTEFPSDLDDALITTAADDIEDYSQVKSAMASYKCVSSAFFVLRKLQAEIVQELYARKNLPDGFTTIHEWREHMNARLDKWYQKKVPKTTRKMNCNFTLELFQLELHHSKVLLYGLCPKSMTLDEHGFRIVYHNTKGIIDVYYKLCREKNIMYTWVAVHNLFMAGMTYLYVLHNASVELRETIQDPQKTCAQLVYVLEKLVGKCEAARKGSIIFKVLSAVILKLQVENASKIQSVPQQEDQRRESESNMVALGEESPLYHLLDTGKGALAPTVDSRALDQFFSELDKLPSLPGLADDFDGLDKSGPVVGPITSEDPKFGQSQVVPVIEGTDDLSNGMDASDPTSKASTWPEISDPRDGQRVYDMMSQFSTETIWDQVFSNGGFVGLNG
ncbi:LADA_0E08636g1_1 [Lachancea dasiensis]|uniref:LADA_0E08636g1_1 n=1 Tax=Lachancea dasiensis TaxID=1072105 RepID=A0A1G4JDA8_9SACH|nr:LADA_0E08636g1_1 [Lachancea dasiensis]